jgi:hypothetical protein
MKWNPEKEQKQDRPVTAEEFAELIEIITEMQTYGGPAMHNVTPRTVERLKALKERVDAEPGEWIRYRGMSAEEFYSEERIAKIREDSPRYAAILDAMRKTRRRAE